jgi:hypothetical protein
MCDMIKGGGIKVSCSEGLEVVQSAHKGRHALHQLRVGTHEVKVADVQVSEIWLAGCYAN